jgi:hypothetical protein
VLTITLTFKSIEAARAALLEIPSSSLVGGDAPEAAEAQKAAPARAVKAPVATKTVAGLALDSGEFIPAADLKVEAPKPAPVVEATTSSAKPSASVDYPTLQKAVFALAGKSRDAAAAVAASFSVKTFKELPEAKWADALAAVNVALAA